ncbi:MAG: hypothetical protein ACRYGP_31040 [Janthinobacterium lividum]
MRADALRRAARVLFWLALAYVAFVTLSPIADRPETPFGPNVERFGAFAFVSLSLMIGYPKHRLGWFIGLVTVAGVLEASQGLVDGRHGRLHDFVIKSAGAAAGALAALAIVRLSTASINTRP